MVCEGAGSGLNTPNGTPQDDAYTAQNKAQSPELPTQIGAVIEIALYNNCYYSASIYEASRGVKGHRHLIVNASKFGDINWKATLFHLYKH